MAAKKSDLADGEGQATDQRTPRTRVHAARLKAALGDVNAVISPKSTIPITTHVLLQAIDGRLVLTGTDLDHWLVRDLASNDGGEPDSRDWQAGSRNFGLCLPGKALETVVGELDPDAMVTITAAEDRSGATITAGRSRFRIKALPVADFPLPPAGRGIGQAGFSLPCAALDDALAGVAHAISTEETRYYLNGVFLHPIEDRLQLGFATTDGHRLALREIDAPDGATTFPAVIVARRTVAVLQRLCGEAVKAADKDGSPPEVHVSADETDTPGARLRWVLPASDGGDVELVAKTVDGEFPQYRRVIPPANDKLLTIDRTSLAAAVKRVAALQDKSRVVKCDLTEDRLTLTVTSAELGEASEDLPCSYGGEPLTIGIDSAYWRAALSALACADVAMAFSDAGGPILLQPMEDGATPGPKAQVLMPVRV